MLRGRGKAGAGGCSIVVAAAYQALTVNITLYESLVVTTVTEHACIQMDFMSIAVPY